MRAPLSFSKTSKVKRNLQLNAADEAKGQSPLEQGEKANLSQNVNSIHNYILDTHSSAGTPLILNKHQCRFLRSSEDK